MANTYSKILLHFVIAVKCRRRLISEAIKAEIEPYICNIIKHEKCLAYAIYCNPDHTHILVRMSPDKAPSDLMRVVKSESTKFINKKFFPTNHFSWQVGYATFSLRENESHIMKNYILNQKEHHSKKSFKNEFVGFLKENEIEYDEKFLFEFNEEI